MSLFHRDEAREDRVFILCGGKSTELEAADDASDD